MIMKKKIYDSETGDVMQQQDGDVLTVEPLRVPGVVDDFMSTYIPAPDEHTASDVLSIGELRDQLCCWMTFGSKTDVLQEYLDILADNGYVLQNTSSGPALCVIRRYCDRVFFNEAEEVKD